MSLWRCTEKSYGDPAPHGSQTCSPRPPDQTQHRQKYDNGLLIGHIPYVEHRKNREKIQGSRVCGFVFHWPWVPPPRPPKSIEPACLLLAHSLLDGLRYRADALAGLSCNSKSRATPFARFPSLSARSSRGRASEYASSLKARTGARLGVNSRLVLAPALQPRQNFAPLRPAAPRAVGVTATSPVALTHLFRSKVCLFWLPVPVDAPGESGQAKQSPRHDAW
jgi:hypothetical protein